MQTSLRIDGANCPTCFNETIDALADLDGVRDVHGSLDGPCIEVDHEIAIETITGTIRDRLHGIEMFSAESPNGAARTDRGVRDVLPPPTRGDRAAASGTPPIDPSMTLGEIVTLRPSLAADLERRGLDYCCHGGRTLAEAAREVGLDAQTVADELSAAPAGEPAADWASLAPAELVDHIESLHHRYLWAELPRVSALVDKIATVHGERHPELADVQRLFTELRADLEPHLAREEQQLFPMIRAARRHDRRTAGRQERAHRTDRRPRRRARDGRGPARRAASRHRRIHDPRRRVRYLRRLLPGAGRPGGRHASARAQGEQPVVPGGTRRVAPHHRRPSPRADARHPAAPAFERLGHPAAIAEMVRRFYSDVAQDDLLGPMFNTVAGWTGRNISPS